MPDIPAQTEIILIPSTKARHPQIIYKNYIHHQFQVNKDTSIRYVCSEKSKGCKGYITVNSDRSQVLRESPHSHIELTNEEIKCIIAKSHICNRFFLPITFFCFIIQ